MDISHNFDGGNIEILACESPRDIQLEIRKDHQSNFSQWFYFRLTGARNQNCLLHIRNIKETAYPDGFANYRVLYSYDREQWVRHHTYIDTDSLVIDITPTKDSIYFAYFVPYSMERHNDLIARAIKSECCSYELLGKTLDNRDLDLLTFSKPNDENKLHCWIIARQHPGETMAEWWMEGCIEKLLTPRDELTENLLKYTSIHLVPNMNPDGSFRGHIRTNAAGRNLNREWKEPSKNKSPEVYTVRKKILETGADFFLDIHGDESLPFCFIAGTEGISTWNLKKQKQLDFFKNRLAQVNNDFQTEEGYPTKNIGFANMSMSTSHIAFNHGCLAMTLEMPFKDTIKTPDKEFGWSVERCKKLAHSCLLVIDEYLTHQYFRD